jgi:transposase
VRRRRNDRADAEVIAEAALRPAMRFVAVKSEDTQARAPSIGLEPMAPDERPFRTHQHLVRQRTQSINAPRGHHAESGLVAPEGPASLKVLENALEDEGVTLPTPVRETGAV